MSQFPPPPAGPYAPNNAPYYPPQNPTNGLAITSLVTGILGCLVITPFVAIITGLLALKKQGGKAMAIIGIILGVLWIGGGGAYGLCMYKIFSGTAAQRATAQSFITDLSQGNVAAAQQKCASSVSPEELAFTSARVKGFGALTGFAFSMGASVDASNGKSVTAVSGVANFSQGDHQYSVTFEKENGVWKIVHWDIK